MIQISEDTRLALETQNENPLAVGPAKGLRSPAAIAAVNHFYREQRFKYPQKLLLVRGSGTALARLSAARCAAGAACGNVRLRRSDSGGSAPQITTRFAGSAALGICRATCRQV